MKVLAASNIHQFEQAAQSSADYYLTVELGLSACTGQGVPIKVDEPTDGRTGLVVFGSDQGLVGQFNELLANTVVNEASAAADHLKVWVVGERMQMCLEEMGVKTFALFPTPTSVQTISPLVSELLVQIEASLSSGEIGRVLVFHNRPQSEASFEAYHQRLLPFDASWQRSIASKPWPTRIPPEVVDPDGKTVSALILEYLFLALFRDCAESLASENMSRLIAMETAQQNISDTLELLVREFHRSRQNAIDAELFDVVSSFESLLAGERLSPRTETKPMVSL